MNYIVRDISKKNCYCIALKKYGIFYSEILMCVHVCMHMHAHTHIHTHTHTHTLTSANQKPSVPGMCCGTEGTCCHRQLGAR